MFYNVTMTTRINPLSLHDALPICHSAAARGFSGFASSAAGICSRRPAPRSEEHTSELQSRGHLVCRLLLEKKNTILVNSLAEFIGKTRMLTYLVTMTVRLLLHHTV